MCSITMLRMYIPTWTLNSIEILSLFSRVLVTSLFSTQIPNDFIQFKVSLDLKCLGQHLSSSDKKYSALIWTNLWTIFRSFFRYHTAWSIWDSSKFYQIKPKLGKGLFVDLAEFICFYQFLHVVIIKLFCFDLQNIFKITSCKSW